MSNATMLVVPDDLVFSDLNLAIDPDGAVSFEWKVIERICEASNLPVELFTNAPEDNAARLIVAWYQAHLAKGGVPDLVAEELFREVEVEDLSGQPFSYPPGRA